MADIGRKNIEFVREFVDMENMLVLAEDLGDIYPRKVQYVPSTGKVYVKRLRSAHNDTIVQRERKYMNEIDRKPIDGEIDLF
jgi:chemotaxis protein CheD